MGDSLKLLSFFIVTATFGLWFGVPKVFKKDTLDVPLVTAPAGKFQGVRTTSRDGRDIYAYKAIPYAKPPTGSLRFRKPEPLEKALPGIFDATSAGNACPQFNQGFLLGDEDCLTVTVYVPETKVTKKLPVLAWIHGGGFLNGEGTDFVYGPSFLLDKDVILVTIQYRLGPLGFFDLGDDTISGNQGLWDQQLALRWIQKNIGSFGGDPGHVTIFGESAGSMSVVFHLLANNNEGLFQAAMPMSGDPFNGFLGRDREGPLYEYHREVSSMLGCSTLDIKEKVQCLQNLPVRDILDQVFVFAECNPFEGLFMFPAVWKPSNDFKHSKDPFFADTPKNLLESGRFAQVPILMGFNHDEGLLTTMNIFRKSSVYSNFRDNWDQCMVQNVVGKPFKDITKADHELWHDIRDFYLGEKTLQDFSLELKNFQNLTDILTDAHFALGAELTVKSLAQKTKTYFYHFDHLGSFSLSDVFGKGVFELLKTILGKMLGSTETIGIGTCHADDLLYVFSSGMPFKWLPDPKDEEMSRLFVDLITNFATHGNPTPQDKNGHFIGSSLSGLDKPWSPSKLNGKQMEYVILKDSKIDFTSDEAFNTRLKFLLAKVLPRMNYT